jgi:hypothetical protein
LSLTMRARRKAEAGMSLREKVAKHRREYAEECLGPFRPGVVRMENGEWHERPAALELRVVRRGKRKTLYRNMAATDPDYEFVLGVSTQQTVKFYYVDNNGASVTDAELIEWMMFEGK